MPRKYLIKRADGRFYDRDVDGWTSFRANASEYKSHAGETDCGWLIRRGYDCKLHPISTRSALAAV